LLKIVSNREAHKSDVDRARTEADKLFTCRHVPEFNLHLWSTPPELRHNAGNQVERVKAEPDTELSDFTSRCTPHIIKKLICRSHQFTCLVQKQSAHIREACPTATTTKELSPDFRFQLPDPFCQSRLADVQEPGGPAKMQLSGQGQK
jgi:hypothetical protein